MLESWQWLVLAGDNSVRALLRLRAWLDALAFSLSGLDCSGLDPSKKRPSPGSKRRKSFFQVPRPQRWHLPSTNFIGKVGFRMPSPIS